MQMRFSDAELERIIEEAMLYMCACPAQVAVQLRHLRGLFAYQRDCVVDPGNDPAVHRRIMEATEAAHAAMEDCLDDVLNIEGWDRATLTMPAGLRQRRNESLGLE